MKQFLTIIHPHAYQVNERTQTMLLSAPNHHKTIQNFIYNNLEMGSYGSEVILNEPHTISLMIDGIIDNSDEIKQELAKKGLFSNSMTSAELVMSAYEIWQEEFLTKLSGSFALFLFDIKNNQLMIARDRLGQKPIYWSIQGDYVLISTQIKTLLATGLIPQTPALDALSAFLYFGFIPQDLTPIHGINKLLPGHYLKIDLKRNWKIEAYWSLSDHFKTQKKISEEEAATQFEELLKQSIFNCKKQTPLGLLSFPPSTGTNNLEWILSHDPSTKPIPILPSFTLPEILEHLVSIVWMLDEPIADPNVCFTYKMSKEAEKGSIDCCMTAIGFEENLAGAIQPYHSSFAHYLASLPSRLRDYFLIPMSKLFGSRTAFRIVRNIEINEPLLHYLDNIALFKDKDRKKAAPTLFHYFDPEVFTQRFHRLTDIPGTISPFVYFDAKTVLPDSTLLQYERLFSAKDIRIETPFLNLKLVEFLASLPETIKYKNMQKFFGQEMMAPKKPDALFNPSDPLFQQQIHLLTKARIVEEGYISPKWLKQKADLTPQYKRQLWAILIFEIWFRLYIDYPIGSQNPNISVTDLLS